MMKAQVDHRTVRIGSIQHDFASIQKLPGFRWRIHGLTLPKFGYKTQTPAEVGIWRCGSGDFDGDFVGFQLEPSRQ